VFVGIRKVRASLTPGVVGYLPRNLLPAARPYVGERKRLSCGCADREDLVDFRPAILPRTLAVLQ